MKRPPEGSPDLLDHVGRSSGFGRGTPWWGKMLFALLAVAIGSGVYAIVSLTTKVSRAFSAVTASTNENFFTQLRELANPPEKLLRGEEQDRINVLIIGVGGEGHAGSQLADTLIVASYRPSTKRAALLSIPRDLVVEIPGYGFRKINHANAFAEEEGPRGNGVVVTSAVMQKLLGAPMHYSVRVDFGGFEKLIDDIGGIDIDVERSFVDYEYPTEDFGYQTIRFEAGRRHFSGAEALKYVRSRHGNNGEGSDFARSKRQQAVIVAVKKKVFSLETVFNPSRIANGLETLGEHVVTNFAPWELMKLANIGKSFDTNAITTRVLDTSPEGLLINSVGLDGAYILEPRAKDYSEIQDAFAGLLSDAPRERAAIEIQNGTVHAGLAARTASTIASSDIQVVRVRNAEQRNHQKTIIYDLSGGKKPTTLAQLKATLHADVATTLPDLLAPADRALNLSDIGSSLTNGKTLRTFQENDAFAGIDFVVVLGVDQVTDS